MFSLERAWEVRIFVRSHARSNKYMYMQPLPERTSEDTSSLTLRRLFRRKCELSDKRTSHVTFDDARSHQVCQNQKPKKTKTVVFYSRNRFLQ